MSFITTTYERTVNYIRSVDLIFLAFLLLIFNVSLPAKVIGLAFIYVCRFKLKSLIVDFKMNAQPRFYILMITLGIVGLVLNYRLWNGSYFFLTAFGICFWIISALVLNQLKCAVDRTDPVKLHRTIKAFFILNALVSFLNLLAIILITKSNPYTFEGMDLKYHTSTGDSITGILFDFSSTNAIINIFGLIYFLYKQNIKISLLCLAVVMMTTSNVNNIALVGALLIMIVLHKNRLFKTMAACSVAIIVVFYAKVSPSNTEYVTKHFEKKEIAVVAVADPNEKKEPTAEEIKKKQTEIFQRYYVSKIPEKPRPESSGNQKNIKEAIETMQIREKENQSVTDPKFKEQMELKQAKLADYIKDFYHDTTLVIAEFEGKNYPGKIMSCLQTIHYSFSGIKPFIFGAGPGMFSSKAAFKACGIGTFGKYPTQFTYLSPEFLENHLKVYCYFFNQPLDKHSVTNTPFSVYNQLLGEYGLLGVVVFIVFYIWFFLKRFKRLTYGKFLLPLCLFFLIFDYWFEHLSIVIMFELLMLIDMKAAGSEKNKLETNS